jgi:hypothetical protein
MGFLDTLGAPSTPTPTGGFLANLGNNSSTVPPAPTGRLGVPGADLVKDYAANVAASAKSSINQAKQGYNKAVNAKNPLDLLEGSAALGAGTLNAISSPLAPVFKPIGDAVNFFGNKISNIPAVQRFANTPLGGAVARGAEDVSNLSTIAGTAAGIQAGPEINTALGKIGNKLTNVDSAVDVRLGGSAATDAAGSAASKAKTTAIELTNKALSNTGKTTAAKLLGKDQNRLSGLETLYDVTKDQPVTRPDGTTFNFKPTQIEHPTDIVSAFVQAKKQLWQKIQGGLDKGSSLTPDYSPVRATLQDVIDNSASRALKAHAQARLNELDTLDSQGVQGAQRYLQEELNPRIGAAIQGATDAPALKLDAQIANGVNEALDTSLSKVSDGAIRPFKDQYAALKSIEADLVRMVQKVERAPGKGIPQYINDFGNLDLLDAFLTHNPALFVARGLGKKVLAKVLGDQRDPLQNLSKAFQAIEAYKGSPTPLTETPMLALPPGSRGAGSQVGSGAPINLPAQPDTNTRTTFGALPARNK